MDERRRLIQMQIEAIKKEAQKFKDLRDKIKKEGIQKGDKIEFTFKDKKAKPVEGFFDSTINRSGVTGVNLEDGSFHSAESIILESFKKIQ